MNKNELFKLVTVTLSTVVAAVSVGSAGVDPAAYLKSGVGARALGMGGSFVSIAEDTSAMYWNPAGLGKINRFTLAAMGQSAGSSKWDGMDKVTPTYQFIGFTFPVNSFKIPLLNNPSNTFGFGMISSSLSDIPLTEADDNGNITRRETFEDRENAYFISYGIPITSGSDSIYAGATFKYLTQEFSKVDQGNASGYDFDFGLLYSLRGFGLGLMIDRGATMTWDNGHTDTAELMTKFGVSNKFKLTNSLSLLGSVDIVQQKNNPLSSNIGTELGYERNNESKVFGLEGLYLRLGLDGYAIEDRYSYRDKMNNNFNYTAGLGIDVSFFGYYLQMDYAMGSYRLGDKNRLSLNLYF